MNDITFYQRFEADILAGRKMITIRDKSESNFKAGGIFYVRDGLKIINISAPLKC